MKILYATDGSDHAAAARRLIEILPLTNADSVRAISVLSRPMAPSVTGLDLITAAWETVAQIQLEERALAERSVAQAVSGLQERGVDVTMEIREGDAAREILAAAEDWGADLLLLGSRGLSGLERFLLGSVARNVAKHSPTPVLLAREPKNGLAHVVVATDGSDHAMHAVTFAARFPTPIPTQVAVAHVVRPYAPFPGILPTDRPEFEAAVREVNRQHLAAGEALVNEASNRLVAAGKISSGCVLQGDPADELLKLAEAQGADLIVAGARGVSLLEGLMVGSVADRLLKDAPCSVLLVR